LSYDVRARLVSGVWLVRSGLRLGLVGWERLEIGSRHVVQTATCYDIL